MGVWKDFLAPNVVDKSKDFKDDLLPGVLEFGAPSLLQVRGSKNKFATLKLSMFYKANTFPKLAGKGAEIKDLAGPLLDIWTKHFDESQQVHRQIKLALACLTELEEIMELHAQEFKWQREVCQNFFQQVSMFLALLTAIANHFHAQGRFLFNVTVKAHYLKHLGAFSFYLNPRLAWNYAGEDFMQKIKNLVQGSHKGTSAQNVASKVLDKYATGLDLVLRDFADWWC